MSAAIEGLKPEQVWKYFAEISRIPRGSKNEAAISKYILNTAKKLGLQAKSDKLGNVVVRKPASANRQKIRSVALQGHLDMVCEKNKDTVHDFLKDPIEIIRKDNIISANGTTLGADNGIAVATNLAIMEDRSLDHGPLELLFTVDEETGLTGAERCMVRVAPGVAVAGVDARSGRGLAETVAEANAPADDGDSAGSCSAAAGGHTAARSSAARGGETIGAGHRRAAPASLPTNLPSANSLSNTAYRRAGI